MKPEAMTRSEVLHAVLRNYRRFYMHRSAFRYPWISDPFKRRYMMGCLKAALKAGFQRSFYDLGRIGYRGQKEVDFKFDQEKVLSPEQLVQLNRSRERVASVYQAPAGGGEVAASAGATACGGGPATDAQGRPLVAAPPEAPREEAAVSEAPIDEFLDPRGFARQRARARKQSAQKTTLPDTVEDSAARV